MIAFKYSNYFFIDSDMVSGFKLKKGINILKI